MCRAPREKCGQQNYYYFQLMFAPGVLQVRPVLSTDLTKEKSGGCCSSTIFCQLHALHVAQPTVQYSTVAFNIPLSRLQVILETAFSANCSTGANTHFSQPNITATKLQHRKPNNGYIYMLACTS